MSSLNLNAFLRAVLGVHALLGFVGLRRPAVCCDPAVWEPAGAFGPPTHRR
jgi:hypothetical protein